MKKKYALAGAGNRGMYMFAVPIAKRFSDVADLVGIFDPNMKRVEIVKAQTGTDCGVYTDFGLMLADAKPDVVIVATMDSTHNEYIVEALEAGCDVITEKPMTTDEAKTRQILDAERRTGKTVTVTFNMRFMPFTARIKQMVKDGSVGRILSVNLEYFLDTKHGADYYRRWHRLKENSGGMLVHKSSHHFDVVNWLLEDEPEIVNAFGARKFYGPTRSERGERCLTCGVTATCEFYLDINQGNYKRLYLDNEDVDGYFRDRCVFSDDIDIEDTMSVQVKYSQGALLTYSLNTHCPYEGYKLTLNGTDGRIEAEYFHGEVGPYAGEQINRIRLYNRMQEEINIRLPQTGGDHGGGDERLLNMLIRGGVPDPLGQQASSHDGAMSNMIGIAANVSMREGKQVVIKELLSGEGR